MLLSLLYQFDNAKNALLYLQKILFKINPDYSDECWGAINFENTSKPSNLSVND